MRRKLLHIVLFINLLGIISLSAQQTDNVPVRTPEEEAAKQTEMLQRLLPSLNPEQKEQIYIINLKYARERKQYPGRSAAINRMKRKDSEYKLILTTEQYELLQTKCSEQLPDSCPSRPQNSQ